MAGLVGLGRSGLSLISQLGSSVGKKFSYCLVPRTSNSVSSKLSIGANDVASDPNVQSTNLIHVSNTDTFYTVKLHGIKVGDKDVKVTENLIIIDSGTTLNLLNSDVVSQVVSILEKSISLPRVPDENFPLCFNASSVKTIDFPGIDFKFGVSGEATVKMGPNNAFVWLEGGKACLAIAASEDVQIIGNVMQQNLHVGFDLDESKVYFAPADCTKL
ncbi:hypothetical protein LUZ60_017006 [Juncus effusus]|nr:hypothetical protein LUZ60_017006 [Juncus effusus]